MIKRRLTTATQFAQFLNAATGYDAIQRRRDRVEVKNIQVAKATRLLDHAKAAYEDSIDQRRKCQKDINSLLQRKDSWGPLDIQLFTDLYKNDLHLEQKESELKHAYSHANDSYKLLHAEYLDQIRERYIDEQLYSDKIRSASTLWTVGLISMHLAIFVAVNVFLEPGRKRRDRHEIVKAVEEILVKNTTINNKDGSPLAVGTEHQESLNDSDLDLSSSDSIHQRENDNEGQSSNLPTESVANKTSLFKSLAVFTFGLTLGIITTLSLK